MPCSCVFLAAFLYIPRRFRIFKPFFFFSRMAFIRAFQMILIILMVVSMPFLHSSRTTCRSLAETSMAGETSSTFTKELESNYRFNKFKRGSSAFIVEKREVPTGPDPLHHNSHPTGP